MRELLHPIFHKTNVCMPHLERMEATLAKDSAVMSSSPVNTAHECIVLTISSKDVKDLWLQLKNQWLLLALMLKRLRLLLAVMLKRLRLLLALQLDNAIIADNPTRARRSATGVVGNDLRAL